MDREEALVRDIRARIAPDAANADDCIAEVDGALRECPGSSRLWCLRGDLIQLAPKTTLHTLADAREAYERALALDPSSAEACEELGFYFDSVQDDPAAAEPYFRKALALRATPQGHLGLARVLAQLNRADDALSVLEAPILAGLDEAEDLRSDIESGMWSRE
jgi:uncharacterized protein HemY